MNVGIPDAGKHARHSFLEASADVRPGWIPEKSASEWGIALLLFIASVLYLRLFYNYTVLNGDEGIILQGAQRILNGEVLYRDFFSFLTPGSYYWMALLFKVFGDSILVAHGALIVYGGIFSVLTYLLARRVCARWCALFTVYLLTLTCLPYCFFALHNWDSTLWACLALYFAVRLLETPHWGFALAVGTFASLTCLCEQSKGAGLLLGLAAGFGAVAWTDHRKGRLARFHVWAFLAGFAPPVLLTVAYFAAQHSLPQMLADCLWPLRHYLSANALPYGYPGLLDSEFQRGLSGSWGFRIGMLVILSPYLFLPVLPILAVGFFCVWLVRLARQKESHDKAAHYVVVSAIVIALWMSAVISRPDLSHIVIFQGPIVFLVLGWILGGPSIQTRHLNSFRTLVSFYVFLSFTALGLTLLWGPLNANVVLKTRRGVLKVQHGDAVLEELQARVRPGEKIFVYPYQPLYYYLTSTFSPTHYEYLQLGMHTPEQFQEALNMIAERRPRVVLFQPSFYEDVVVSFPSTPIRVLASRDPVSDFILKEYRSCAVLVPANGGNFVFMVRKDLPCPEASVRGAEPNNGGRK
jgi:4-amino-4-deoxy-L-arabinose transferase-like glycosyltransferase